MRVNEIQRVYRARPFFPDERVCRPASSIDVEEGKVSYTKYTRK